ncbi:MAG: hydantoinase/oxoprolinase family protein [Pseudomonadota bacterium]
MANSSRVRLGADIGGTFTDVVLEVDGILHSTKVLTTYSAPENAILDGMRKVCQQSGTNPSRIQQVIHGTTLATNALIERSGAKTALITTQGFRDVIEMRTESRFEQYDLNLELPDALLERQHRYTVRERISAQGEILIPLNEDDVDRITNQIISRKYESVAIGLIHSYLFKHHEEQIRDSLLAKAPQMVVSISSEVSPQMREYERFNTTVANAYIKPLMKSYLDRLEDRLAEESVNCPVFLMHSGGGIISLDSAAEFPVRLVESGPAGGAVFAAHIAERYQLGKVLSFDMGGTTAKICLIKQHTPKTSRVFEVARTYRFKKGSGMPISIPVIDMVEIGAGGGSLAHVDALQQIRVGPESAGSEPGPACYNRGGEKPAVTDADLILGKLDPDNFAGGSIVLDPNRSAEAIGDAIGITLGMDVETAAFGLAEVVDENMANAARVHAVENGEDLSEYTMIAFGGAAPLHAGRLCEKLGIDRLLVPPGAGVGSAIGFLKAPFSFEANRSVYMRLSDFDSETVKSLFEELRSEATEFVQSCDAEGAIYAEYKVYMRYVGQGEEIPVVFDESEASQPDAHRFRQRFEDTYRNLFARTVDGMDVEITVWSVNAATETEQVERADLLSRQHDAQTVGERMIFDPAAAANLSAEIVARQSMVAGQGVSGPAAITEDETTVIVPASREVVRQVDGCLDMYKRSEVRS